MNRRLLFAPILGALFLVLAACSTAPEFGQFSGQNLDGSEGCTPGFWQNEKTFDQWPEISFRAGAVPATLQLTPDTLLSQLFYLPGTFAAFPDLADDTLYEALKYNATGGTAEGHAMKMLRHAVAAALNEGSFPDTYGLSNIDPNLTAWVKWILNGDTIDDIGATTIEEFKDLLEIQNELGCPLNNGGGPPETPPSGGPKNS